MTKCQKCEELSLVLSGIEKVLDRQPPRPIKGLVQRVDDLAGQRFSALSMLERLLRDPEATKDPAGDFLVASGFFTRRIKMVRPWNTIKPKTKRRARNEV